MRVKHAAVVAGLALGLMSGTARAASLEYNVIVPFNDGKSITGTIDTDGKAGVLSSTDIRAYDLFYEGLELSSSNGGTVQVIGTSLFAKGNTLNFDFDGKSNSEFYGANNAGDFTFNFYAGQDSNYTPFYVANGPTDGSLDSVNPGTVLTIGVSEGTVSTVPLPASAPMFGAALMALGAVGYSLKRKGKAAA